MKNNVEPQVTLVQVLRSDLLIKGAALAEANVVLYDALANEELWLLQKH
jgi:hypothetical protein